ncbi:MAG TPA: pyridoxamine 5'-phosphate oxidase family protein [Gemmatimonadaceae bacterium]|nr:pyridoxamine 5'-phosphate oxidase family protein [Gemmatimonadaceae bacterium]
MSARESAILTEDMKRLIDEQRLGFFATVCADGSPNLSPKGTIAVWDDNHLAFGNIRSPGTLENLRLNPAIDVNVVDPFTRKGYRFKGVAKVLDAGPLYERAIDFYRARGSKVSAFKEVVLIEIKRAQFIDSPAYDFGMTEEEIRDRWERHYDSLRAGSRNMADPENFPR